MSVIVEFDAGVKVEYRRGRIDGVILHLEHRVLKEDGTPYDDRWHPVSDEGLLRMQRAAGGDHVIDHLLKETT